MTNDACKYANELVAKGQRLAPKIDKQLTNACTTLSSDEKHYFYHPLEMALFDLANAGDGPLVARSTPKNCAIISNREGHEYWRKREMSHCLYPRQIYENMIKNSIKTCKKVEKDLNDYANTLMKFGHNNENRDKLTEKDDLKAKQ